LPEVDLVRPKYIAIECDFNERETMNDLRCIKDGSEWKRDTSVQQDAETK
jgi:hypothetical protein